MRARNTRPSGSVTRTLSASRTTCSLVSRTPERSTMNPEPSPPGDGVSTTGLPSGAPAYYEVGEPTGAYQGQAPKGVMLVIHGARDRLFPPSHAERIAREARDATLFIYPDGNHVCNNIAYKYRPLMADWLREQLTVGG